jgi:5-oxoprolinase (ATP-hydrolysing) subunit A
MRIDLNCDLGETGIKDGFSNDEAIMPYITSANIACGSHAGDPLTMERTVRLAMRFGVGAGAHPGYPDREGFGRHPVDMTSDELRASILFQVGALKTIAESAGTKLQHVKCHGALYNAATSDLEMSLVIARAVREIDKSLILVGLSGSKMIIAAQKEGLQYASEVFADRAYNDDGSLVSRQVPGAVLHDAALVIRRAVKMVLERSVVTISGKTIPLEADTICIHGDNPKAPEFARELMTEFNKAGINVIAIGKEF